MSREPAVAVAAEEGLAVCREQLPHDRQRRSAVTRAVEREAAVAVAAEQSLAVCHEQRPNDLHKRGGWVNIAARWMASGPLIYDYNISQC